MKSAAKTDRDRILGMLDDQSETRRPGPAATPKVGLGRLPITLAGTASDGGEEVRTQTEQHDGRRHPP